MIGKRKIKFFLRDTVTDEKVRGHFKSDKDLSELKQEILSLFKEKSNASISYTLEEDKK